MDILITYKSNDIHSCLTDGQLIYSLNGTIVAGTVRLKAWPRRERERAAVQVPRLATFWLKAVNKPLMLVCPFSPTCIDTRQSHWGEQFNCMTLSKWFSQRYYPLLLHFYFISNFISILYNHIAINLEDIDKTYANKD